MKTSIKYFFGITGAIAVAILLVLLVVGQASHNFNLQYRLWKIGLTEYDIDRFPRFLGADLELREKMNGKTVDEIENVFGDLISISESTNYQKSHTYDMNYEDFYWIGESSWGIEFKNGKVVRFILSKG